MRKWLIILAFLPFPLLSQWSEINWNDCPKNDIGHPMNFATVSSASNSEKVGTLYGNRNYDTIFTYAMVEDTSGIFAIGGDSVYISDNTGLQSSVTYHITFKITNGSVSDTADGYIYVFDISEGEEWNDVYSSHTTDHFYYFQRNSTYYLDQKIILDDNDVSYIAVGNGDDPLLLANHSSGGNNYMFEITGDNCMIRDLDIRLNDNAYVDFGIKFNENDNCLIDNVKLIASISHGWYNALRYDQAAMAYTHRIHNCFIKYSADDAAWFMNISDHEIINNYLTQLGIDFGDYDCDGFQWASTGADNGSPGFLYNEKRDIRYNLIDHYHYKYKYGFVCVDSLGWPAYDTIMHNKIIGPGLLNGDTDYSFNGIAVGGQNYAYVAYNYMDSCDRGLTVAGGLVKHITWENNVINGAIEYGFLNLTGVDSSYLIHNTFINPAFEGVDYVISGAWTAADTFANNIFHVKDGQTLYQTTDMTRMYNIYTDLTGTGYSKEATEIEGDPLFTDEAGMDFTLQLGSPAIDEGYNFNIVYDFEGNIRDATPDIGAYEYQTESESSTVTYKGSISLDDATINGQEISTIKYKGVTYKE